MSTNPGTRVRIEFAQASDPGRDPNKQVNEDSCGYADTKFGHVIVLCDGMGGHYGGKEASRTAISTIFEVVERTAIETPPAQVLKLAIEEAGRRVYLLGGPPENRTRPGSTVVSLLLHDQGLDVAHVGDSRGYIIRANQIYPLTRDHSMVQAMIDAGMLTEEQAIGHPDANKITRALGMKPEVDVEVRPEPMDLFSGDLLLLSSDGLTDVALAPDILGAVRQSLASGDVQHACNMLVTMANNRGGPDNVTVQIARVKEVPAKARQTIPEPMQAGAASAAAPQASAPQQRPQETYPMTANGVAPTAPPLTPHVGHAPGPTPPAAPLHDAVAGPPRAAMPQGQAPVAMQWAPVPPTAMDYPPSRVQVGPTVTEAAPVSQAWSSGVYGGPGAGPVGPTPPMQGATPAPPPAGLASYRVDPGSPAALPLPPHASGLAPPAPTVGPTFAGPMSDRPYGDPLRSGAPMPGAYPMAGPASPSMPEAPPARGGIVFLIIGLSVVVAVLLLVVLWALFAR